MGSLNFASIERNASWIARRIPTIDRRDLFQESVLRQLMGRKSTVGPMIDLLRREGWLRKSRPSSHADMERCEMPVLIVDERKQRDNSLTADNLMTLCTPLQREAIGLRLWEGLTTREIAKKLGIPITAAAMRVEDGFQTIRRRIAQ